MSWHFSRALVEESSEAICSDGEQSAQLNGNPTPQAYLCSDRMTAFSRLSRFGMTFAPLTESRGEELLMSYLADFRARTYQQQEPALESTESAAGSGVKWLESSVRYDRDSCSWKTHRCLWEEALPWSSVTLPRWGMTLDGVVYQHPTLERPINVTGSGLWQTPTVSCAEHPGQKAWKPSHQLRLTQQVNNPHLWPTPCATDHSNRLIHGSVHVSSTGIPKHIGKTGELSQMRLSQAVKLWPTPVTSMAKGSSPATLTRKNGKDRSNDRLDHAVMASDGGQLNPTWVEWLMGWPLGWTDLKPLEMDKFREWQLQHGGF